jgi:hypothetical protein
MKKDEAIGECYRQQIHSHSRWNTWAVFYFGTMVTIFSIWKETNESIPFYIPCFLTFIISFLWILVTLSLKKSSWVWLKMLKRIEGQARRIASKNTKNVSKN